MRFLLHICVMVLLALACDKDSGNPVGPGTSDEYGSIVVTTADNNGVPTEGVSVTIRQEGKDGEMTFETNAEGVARFDSLPPGDYSIWVENYDHETSDKIIPEAPELMHNMNFDNVSAGEMVQKTFYFPVGPVDVSILVRPYRDMEVPYDNVELFFPDWGRTVALDAQGYGILDNVVLTDIDLFNGLYGFASSDGKTGEFYARTGTDSNGRLYLYITIRSEPLLEIVTPQNGALFPTGSIQLTCTSNDFEDGTLPDEAISWRSDIDGDLGTGHDIHVDLSIGKHKITIRGVDSEGEMTEQNMYVTISNKPVLEIVTPKGWRHISYRFRSTDLHLK